MAPTVRRHGHGNRAAAPVDRGCFSQQRPNTQHRVMEAQGQGHSACRVLLALGIIGRQKFAKEREAKAMPQQHWVHRAAALFSLPPSEPKSDLIHLTVP